VAELFLGRVGADRARLYGKRDDDGPVLHTLSKRIACRN